MRIVLLVFFGCAMNPLYAQKKQFTRMFQASLTPGLSTNGIHPGGFNNYISLHLTSGYSRASYLFEIATISNLNVVETRGLQVAGLANLTGANAFAGLQPKEIDKMKRDGFESNVSGIQISGLTNLVVNNIFGAQLSGGVNIAGGALQGLQVAGIANMVNKYSFGIQFAGLWNISVASMDGAQISLLYNMTRNELFGVQAGLWNSSGVIHGKNSYENNDPTGLQIGVFNKAAVMNGFQIGIINLGKQVQGTQIGLINIYGSGKTPQTRDGTSIGLINVGSTGYVAAYANELFLTNFEVATGTLKNRRMSGENATREILNGLIYSRNLLSANREAWALGYGIKKMYLNRSAAPGMSNIRFLMAGIDALHYSHTSKLTRELSLIARPHVTAGSRLHPKNRTFFLFVSFAYNVYKSSSGEAIVRVYESDRNKNMTGFQSWPGFAAGVLVR